MIVFEGKQKARRDLLPVNQHTKLQQVSVDSADAQARPVVLVRSLVLQYQG